MYHLVKVDKLYGWQKTVREGQLDEGAGSHTPERETDTGPSWFGFLMTVSPESPVTRDAIVSYLEAHDIQTRPLFAGNLTWHPCLQDLREGVGYRVAGELEITDLVMNNSFWVGVYPGMERAMLDEIVWRIREKFSTDVP